MIYDWALFGNGIHAPWLASRLSARNGASVIHVQSDFSMAHIDIRSNDGEKLSFTERSLGRPLEPPPTSVLEVWAEWCDLSLYHPARFESVRAALKGSIEPRAVQLSIHESAFEKTLEDLGHPTARSEVSSAEWAAHIPTLTDFKFSRLVHSGDKVLLLGQHRDVSTQIAARRLILCGGTLFNSLCLRNCDFLQEREKFGTRIALQPRAFFAAEASALSVLHTIDRKWERLGIQLRPLVGNGIELIIEDEPNAWIELGRRGRITLRKTFTETEKERLQIGFEVVREIFSHTAQQAPEPSTVYHVRELFGGARAGADALEHVVDEDFSVRERPGLYVVDESALPGAPGCQNGFLTTMVVAQEFLNRLKP